MQTNPNRPSLSKARLDASTHIGVAVDHGAVTLSGEVNTYPERLLAEKAALRVHGVTAVAEEIKVNYVGGSANDSDIAREASEALDRSVNVPSDSVKAIVNGHFITLSGQVAWQFQREAAERSVRYLKGVTGVFNQITIKPTVSANGLKNTIGAAFVRSAQLEGKDIKVTADAGTVTLEGSVHSWSDRRQADTSAWAAPGVTSVTNHLRVIG